MSHPLRASDPRRIGAYAVESRLGEGGMGVVYLARDEAGTPVAVKVIQHGLLEDEAGIVRFRREIAALRRLDRFCTARLLDADAAGDPPYLVTEFVSGPTLSEAVVRDGPLEGPDLESAAIGIAAALRHIHLAGITHRDLKPANVLLSPYGPRVIDFGLALHSEVSRRVTSSFVVGTPGYMAPEQLGRDDVGAPADVFAWGAVVAFAATGRPPFGGGPVREVVFRVLGGEADLDGLTGPLRAIVTTALAKDPAERPTSDELVGALRNLAPTQEVLASAAEAPQRTSVRAPEPSTRAHTLTTMVRDGGEEGLTRAFEIAPEDGAIAGRYVRHLLANTGSPEAIDWITGTWDRATPATKAAIWEEIPGWFEERYPEDSYKRSRARALEQELAVHRLLSLRPPFPTAQWLWGRGRYAFQNRGDDRAVNIGCLVIMALVALGLLAISAGGGIGAVLLFGTLILVTLVILAIRSESPGRSRRKAFERAGLPYVGEPGAELPDGYRHGPDFGKSADYATVIEPAGTDEPG